MVYTIIKQGVWIGINLYTFLFGVIMKGRRVIAIDENGKEYIFPSITIAVTHLNIAPTTIKRHADMNKLISTKLGRVQIRFENNGK